MQFLDDADRDEGVGRIDRHRPAAGEGLGEQPVEIPVAGLASPTGADSESFPSRPKVSGGIFRTPHPAVTCRR